MIRFPVCACGKKIADLDDEASHGAGALGVIAQEGNAFVQAASVPFARNGGGVAGSGLKTFRCRVRASGCTTTIECVAPSAKAAAYVVARPGLEDDRVPWVQVVVAEWSGVLGEYIDPGNALIVAASDSAPEGAELVVLCSVVRTMSTASDPAK
jgi:hypothetical protein